MDDSGARRDRQHPKTSAAKDIGRPTTTTINIRINQLSEAEAVRLPCNILPDFVHGNTKRYNTRRMIMSMMKPTRMRATILCWMMALLALMMLAQETQGFVKGSPHVNARPVFISTTPTELNAEAKKKKAATKKKAAAGSSKAKAAAAPVETLRKAEIVASIAEKLDCTKAVADDALAAVLGTITENVVAGKKVNLPGFGSFQLRARAARKGRNPQTGEEIDIKASNSPGFTAAKAFKEAANE